MGTEAQPVLQKFGDDLRIDWGYLYVAAPTAQLPHTAVASTYGVIESFRRDGSLPSADTRMPREAGDDMPTMAVTFNLDMVAAGPIERHVILAYDQMFAIEYFHKQLAPYWKLKRDKASDLLFEAERNYAALVKRCENFDATSFPTSREWEERSTRDLRPSLTGRPWPRRFWRRGRTASRSSCLRRISVMAASARWTSSIRLPRSVAAESGLA